MIWGVNYRVAHIRKGQVSPDYLVTIIFLGLIVFVVLAAFGRSDAQAFQVIERVSAKGIAETVAKAIESTAIMGDGSFKEITLEGTILGGKSYNMTIRGNAVLVRWGDRDYAARFSTANVNGSYYNGSEVYLQPGGIMLNNTNGTVFISNPKWDLQNGIT